MPGLIPYRLILKTLKLMIEFSFSIAQHVKGWDGRKVVDMLPEKGYEVPGIMSMCKAVRHEQYQVVIILSGTRRHHLDMTYIFLQGH